MPPQTNLRLAVITMGVVVVVSNILVQYPLGEWLTYGALTYPFAFLVTDLVTRRFGTSAARQVIAIGVIVGIICSLAAAAVSLTTIRIALASALAFAIAQLLDVKLFMRFAHLSWWQRPALSSGLGSIIDTTIFFFIAFSASTFMFLPDQNEWALVSVPLIGIGQTFPLWISLAVADLGVKLLMIVVLLLPYRFLTTLTVPSWTKVVNNSEKP